MKTNILHFLSILFLTLMVSVSPAQVRADGSTVEKDKTSTGTVTAVSATDKVIKVRGYLFTKSYVVSDACTLMMGDRRVSLADFQPGQRVEVAYKDANGVLVASRITQEKLTQTGQVTGIDLVDHTITIRQHATAKSFTLPDNCAVVLNGNSKGTFSDVKLGQRITIVYEIPNNELVARQIEQKSLEYVGTLDAINLADRTVSAGKKLLGDKRFHLASDCAIVKNGKLDGRMSDLRLGHSYELSYDTVDGVNVVSRIAPAPNESEKAEGAAGMASAQTKNN